MQHDHEHYHKPEHKEKWWQTNTGMLLVVFFTVGGYYLIKAHGAHIAENWFLLILLLCPLMHVFMHGGHGGHGKHRQHDDNDNDREA